MFIGEEVRAFWQGVWSYMRFGDLVIWYQQGVEAGLDRVSKILSDLIPAGGG